MAAATLADAAAGRGAPGPRGPRDSGGSCHEGAAAARPGRAVRPARHVGHPARGGDRPGAHGFGLLPGAAWLGARGAPSAAGDQPLPQTVPASELAAIEEALRKAGIAVTRYDADEKAVFVAARDRARATLALIRNGMANASNINANDLNTMASKLSFTDTHAGRVIKHAVARGNHIANLIAAFDSIAEADVVYNEDARSTTFLKGAPPTAAVTVKTRLGRPLDPETAQSIIKLVAFAKSGLDPANVVVTDRLTGRPHHYRSARSGLSMANDAMELEDAHNARLARQAEEIILRYIPGLMSHGGGVTIVPSHKFNVDEVERAVSEYRDGVATHKLQESSSRDSLRGPPWEAGVQPNVVTSTVVDAENRGSQAGREERHETEKRSETRLMPTVEQEVRKVAPDAVNVALTVIIQMPYELERDAEGRAVPEANEYGEPLLHPDTRRPVLRLRSAPLLPDGEVLALRDALAAVAHIPLEDVADKVFIRQVPWAPPVFAPPGADPWATALARTLRENAFTLFAALALGGLLLIVAQQARAQVRTALDPEEAPEGEIATRLEADLPAEDPAQAEMEATRQRVRESVMEDPKRAAALIHRWMTREG